MSAEKQKRILKKCPDILVATPGRLWELVEQVSAWLIAKGFFNDGYTKCFWLQISHAVSMSEEREKIVLCYKCSPFHVQLIFKISFGKMWKIKDIWLKFCFKKDPYLARIDEVDSLVIDEADRMIEKGHFEELTQILAYINR